MNAKTELIFVRMKHTQATLHPPVLQHRLGYHHVTDGDMLGLVVSADNIDSEKQLPVFTVCDDEVSQLEGEIGGIAGRADAVLDGIRFGVKERDLRDGRESLLVFFQRGRECSIGLPKRDE